LRSKGKVINVSVLGLFEYWVRVCMIYGSLFSVLVQWVWVQSLVNGRRLLAGVKSSEFYSLLSLKLK